MYDVPMGSIYDNLVKDSEEEGIRVYTRDILERSEIDKHIELMNCQIDTEKSKSLYYKAMTAKIIAESDQRTKDILDKLINMN